MRWTKRDASTVNPALLLAALLTAAAASGCGGETTTSGPAAPPPQSAGDASAGRGARTLAIPPLPGQARTGQAAQLVWDVPDGWIAEPPGSSMRFAQYVVPGPGGDATCVVYYFGPGQGGDPMANAQRWAGQFEQPDGVPSTERMTVETIAEATLPTRIVSVRGTYNGGMTMTDQPSPSQPGAMLLGGIAEGPDAPWFFKLTGPEATVSAQRDSLVGLLRSLRPAPVAR